MRYAWTWCFLLTACQGAPPPIIDQAKVMISRPVNGAITVEGAPGAVKIAGASTVSLVVLQEAASDRTVLHLGGEEVPIASVTAKVTHDGGFESVTLGNAETPILPDDELTLTPFQGFTQAGYTLLMFVPMRPSPGSMRPSPGP